MGSGKPAPAAALAPCGVDIPGIASGEFASAS